MGLGGKLEGFVGRTAQIDIGDFELANVITNFQDVSPQFEIDSTFLNERHGIIGTKILDRFSIIIDYIREDIYMRPNRRFKKQFKYDRSGLSVAASGEGLTDFVVINVVPGSPADEAGIQVGDEIKRLNGTPSVLLSMENVIHRLQRKVGKRTKVVLKRDGETMRMTFYLRELI